MFKKLTEFTERYAHHPHTEGWLFFYAVIESVFFPVPPDVLLIALGLMRPTQALRFATIAAVGSVTGGLIGYAIGRFAFEPIALPVMNYFGVENFLPELQRLFDEHGLWVVGVSAMSPVIPYRFTILAAGLGHMAVVPFILMSLVMHWLRYALVTWLVAHYGRKAVHVVRDQLPWVFGGMGALALVVYIVWIYF